MDCDSSPSVLFLLLLLTVLALRTKKGLLHCSRCLNFFSRSECFSKGEFLFKWLNTFVVDASSLYVQSVPKKEFVHCFRWRCMNLSFQWFKWHLHRSLITEEIQPTPPNLLKWTLDEKLLGSKCRGISGYAKAACGNTDTVDNTSFTFAVTNFLIMKFSKNHQLSHWEILMEKIQMGRISRFSATNTLHTSKSL